ncbi:type II toxin-antitoxin system HicA family toxin [Streptomyces sp. NPDC057433]|uniref:type II toxin-antitoxin system HicA family toxin n=1 Tax=Streptomyces sp. NPDC057433 TaxID=3346132 RepID=UPI0036C942E6
MSPAVPTGLSGAVVAKALERGGFEHITTRGSHAKHRSGERIVIVPLHRSLAPGALRSVPCQPVECARQSATAYASADHRE